MSGNQKPRMNALLRENHGKHKQAGVAREWAVILELAPSAVIFIGLEETDKLCTTFDKQRKNLGLHIGTFTKTIALETNNLLKLQECVSQLKDDFSDVEMVILHDKAEYTGGILVSLQYLLEHWQSCVSLDDRDISAISRCCTVGLSIDFISDYTESDSDTLYRIVAWVLKESVRRS